MKQILDFRKEMY